MKPDRMWDQWKQVVLTSPPGFSSQAFSGVDLQKEEARLVLISSLGIADEDTLDETEETVTNAGLIYKRRIFTMRGWKK